MKGITHFAVGVAVASCFPGAVDAGAAGNPLYFVLGGVAGILPDTLDFKFVRFFYRHDIEITPDPLCPSAREIAEGIARGVAMAVGGDRPVRIKLNTIQKSANEWIPYRVRFNVAERKIEAVVATEGSAGRQNEYAAELCADVRLEYEAETAVDILDGPMIEIMPNPGGSVTPRLIPWHRLWTHGVLLGLAAVGAGLLVGGLTGGLVAGAAHFAHVLLDQFGFMGSSLWFPIRARRVEGLKKVRGAAVSWNFWTVWCACLLVFWNLYAGADWRIAGFNPLKLFLYGAIMPFLLSRILVARLRGGIR